jgi:uncharacterized OsmC-like protein
MTLRGANEFEIVFQAKGTASGKMRSEIDLTWVRPDGRNTHFQLATDESVALGGEDSAPPPLAYFAASMVGCLMTHVRAFSKTMRIPVRDVDVDASFRWRGRRASEAPYESRLEAIALDIEIDSDAAEGDLLRLIAAAKQGCFIEQSLSSDVAVSHRLKRRGGWTSL